MRRPTSLLWDATGKPSAPMTPVEPAFAAFVRASAALLRDRVTMMRVSHDVGWVCTLGLVVMTQRSPVIVAVARPHGNDTAVAAATLLLAPAVGHAPCALVHQYDRSALPIMVANALTGHRAGTADFCQEDGRETKLCWTAAEVREGRPPREVLMVGHL